MNKILSINISKRKGTAKRAIPSATLVENSGILGDAHAGTSGIRQVSFLGSECIEEFNLKGAKVEPGAFGENIIVEGIDFTKLPIGTLILINGTELEISKIGKECHDRCAIYHKMGDCIMPRNGVFGVVKKGGDISVGDVVEIIKS